MYDGISHINVFFVHGSFFKLGTGNKASLRGLSFRAGEVPCSESTSSVGYVNDTFNMSCIIIIQFDYRGEHNSILHDMLKSDF